MDLPSGPRAMSQPAASTAATSAAEKAADLRQDARLREASRGFEALFLHQMMKSGRGAGFDNELVESSATESTRAMLDGKLAEAGAARAGLGLADAIYRQFAGVAGVAPDPEDDAS